MSNKSILKDKQAFLTGLVLLILGTLVFLYWGSQKEVWFCDEIYSYESANGIEQDWPANNINQWMSGEDVEAFFSADSDQLSYEAITVRLYCDHVPLYFWLFRTVSFLFFKGSGSIWIGLSINLFFYLCFIVLVYKVSKYLTKSPYIASAVVLLSTIINRVMMMQATMLRMYMMLVFAEALLLVAAMKILIRVKEGEKPWKSFALLYIASVFGFLIHYDFWIFYGCVAAISCLYLLWHSIKEKGKQFYKAKSFKYMLIWVLNFVLSLGTELVIFPYSRWNLNRGKGQMAMHEMVDFSTTKFDQILWGYKRLGASLFADIIPYYIGLLILILTIGAGIYILSKKKEYNKRLILVSTVLIAQAYQLAVCFVMPDVNEERYLWGGFTFMHLVAIWGGLLLLQAFFEKYRIQKKYKNAISVFTVVVILGASWLSMNHGDAIMYLTHPEKDMQLLEENRDVPWIVYGPTVGVYSYYDWLLPEEICFITEENTDDRNLAIQKLQNEERVIIYTEEGFVSEIEALLEEELGKSVTVEYLTKSTNLTVYAVTLSK